MSGLCNNERIDKLLKNQQEKNQYGGDCNICRQGAQEVKKSISQLSRADVEAKALELCGYLGSFSTACMETVMDQSNVMSYYLEIHETQHFLCLILGNLQLVD